MLNESIHYQNGALFCDAVPVSAIADEAGTPVYIYSLKRALSNLKRIQTAFGDLQPHIHYSAKANANLGLLRALVQAGTGIDAVSGGEIFRALKAGAPPENIVFAGVGKTTDELRYALENGIGWFNVENVDELRILNELAAFGHPARIAVRLNPEVTASTHPYIATGHGGAKFGLTAETIRAILARQHEYPNLNFAGIHIHIGSQLHDTEATLKAVRAALELIVPYPHMRTVNIGGGLPVAYSPDEQMPAWEDFAATIASLLTGYTVLLEPGRSIIADAGILVATVLYVKQQAGQIFLITDASMAELIRPALYQAHHEIVPLVENTGQGGITANIVGPVCETADVLGKERQMPAVQPGDRIAILNAGAYGMVMSSNYNQRLRPPEVLLAETGESWYIARRRETLDDLTRQEY
jgi:diaminopimelate decarboxylase